MGVSGSGKTTFGQLLATRLGLCFFDADDYHPRTNKEKMTSGIALSDADRQPWLETLSVLLESNAPCVLACSALKESYRVHLARNSSVIFVYLKGSFELLTARLAAREHFFNPVLLASQFAILEEPSGAIVLDVAWSLEEMVDNALRVVNPQ
jgi:gluconokinase